MRLIVARCLLDGDVGMRTDGSAQLLEEVVLNNIFWNHLPMVAAPPAKQEGVLSVPMFTIC